MFIPRRRQATVNIQSDTITLLKDGLDSASSGRQYPFRRGTIQAQGSTTQTVTVAGNGEGTTADLHNYPMLIPYTTSVIGALGGPAQGHDVLIQETSKGNPVILGQLLTTGVAIPGAPVVSSLTNGSYSFALGAVGHVGTSGGSTPTVSYAAALGTVTGSTLTGDDSHFSLSFTTGTIIAGAATFSVFFAQSYANANYVVAMGAGTDTVTSRIYVSSKSTGSITFTLGAANSATPASLDVIVMA